MELSQIAMKNFPMSGRSAIVPIRQAEGMQNDLWLSKEGAAVEMPWKQALVLEGRCFQVQVGALITGIASGSATVPELAEPECIISVPTGTVIMPYRINCTCNADTLATDNSLESIIIGWDRGKVYDGTGTHTTEVAYNLRGDNPRSTNCTCTSAHTDDITSIPVILTELCRKDVHIDVTSAVALGQITIDLLYEPQAAPFIVGPAMLVIMWGGTSPLTGFAQVEWAEFSKSELGIV